MLFPGLLGSANVLGDTEAYVDPFSLRSQWTFNCTSVVHKAIGAADAVLARARRAKHPNTDAAYLNIPASYEINARSSLVTGVSLANLRPARPHLRILCTATDERMDK